MQCIDDAFVVMLQSVKKWELHRFKSVEFTPDHNNARVLQLYAYGLDASHCGSFQVT